MKKILSILISGMVLYTAFPFSVAHAENNEEYVCGDGHFETVDDFNESLDSSLSLNLNEHSLVPSDDINAIIPSNYDISTNSATRDYFPSIGNQLQIGSCGGFATTYYQFTYEMNKYRGITTTNSNTYSPSWTYNYVNGGADNGAFLSDCYNVLKNQGALTLEDFPYNGYQSNYSYDWCSNQTKLLDALQYRVASVQTITASSGTDTTNLNKIKASIASGHVGVVWVDALRWEIRQNADGEYAVVQGGTNIDANDTESGGHFMAVVGYDNNFQITVNGVTLTGAFKLANSWGTDWDEGNDGYIWVCYDALTSNNTHGNNFNNDFDYPRAKVFGSNQFSFITVQQCDVYFAGIILFVTNNPNGFNIRSKIGSSPYSIKRNVTSYSNLQNSTTKYIAFDYFDSNGIYDLSDYLSQNWIVELSSKIANNGTYRINPRMVDNLGKYIVPVDSLFGSLSSGSYTKTTNVNLAKGRVSNYDSNEITSYDAQLVQRYVVGLEQFSNLQKYLADYNNDGVVDIRDVVAMNVHISSLNGNKYSIYDYIPEWGCSLADLIDDEDEIIANQVIECAYSTEREVVEL